MKLNIQITTADDVPTKTDAQSRSSELREAMARLVPYAVSMLLEGIGLIRQSKRPSTTSADDASSSE